MTINFLINSLSNDPICNKFLTGLAISSSLIISIQAQEHLSRLQSARGAEHIGIGLATLRNRVHIASRVMDYTGLGVMAVYLYENSLPAFFHNLVGVKGAAAALVLNTASSAMLRIGAELWIGRRVGAS